jgi:hypothetical protein
MNRFQFFVAEREGFEPPGPLEVQRFSRPPRSTAPASLHAIGQCAQKPSKGNDSFYFFEKNLYWNKSK